MVFALVGAACVGISTYALLGWLFGGAW